MSSTPHHRLPFFVYGTLRRGQRNHRLLRDNMVTCEPAEVRDHLLYDAGGFPYAAPAHGNRLVGNLVDVDARGYTGVLASLDRLEGFSADNITSSHYVRVECWAQVTDGRRRPAWIYLAGPGIDLPRYLALAAGDWTTRPLTDHSRRERLGR